MNKYLQSSLASIALATTVWCSVHQDDFASVISIPCDDPANPTSTIKMRVYDMIEWICSYSRVELVPGDIYYNTAKHCLTMSEAVDFHEDGILAHSLTQAWKRLNDSIDTISALWKMPKALPVSSYTNKQMDNKAVTIFLSNPNAWTRTKSCYKITGPYLALEGYWFVLMRPIDYQMINKLAWKDNTFGWSSGSAVLDDKWKIFWRFIASTNWRFSKAWTVLVIHPIRESDGSIHVHKNQIQN